MVFTHSVPIRNNKELSWYWDSKKKNFIEFPDTEVYGGKLVFSHPLDYFELDSDTAERLRLIGKPFDIFNNPLQISKSEFEINIFKGLNDDDGIGSLLWQFTNPDRERLVYLSDHTQKVQKETIPMPSIPNNMCLMTRK